MPFADLSSFEKNPEVSNLSDLFTVALITNYIQGKLDVPVRTEPECSAVQFAGVAVTQASREH